MSRHAVAGGGRLSRLRYLLLVAWIGCAAAAGADGGAVVASTEWTAAFARAAGIPDVTVLAPAASRHPAEYQLRPSDLRAVAAADALIFAGYEAMADRLRELARQEATVLRIDTDYSLATLRRSLEALQAAGGMPAASAASLHAIAAEYAEWRSELAARGLAGAPALVHRFQEPLARELGYRGVGVFVTQVVPFPQDDSQAVVVSYQRALAAHDPDATPGFVSLEGYLAGRLAIIGMERCGRDLDRQCFLDSLLGGEAFDIDGFTLSFGEGDNQGSDAVFVSVIGFDGRYYPVETLRGLATPE